MSALSRSEAEALWASLKGNLLAAEDDIRTIIDTRAWEPLGFDSFVACWEDRLHELNLSSELRAVVVYAMFDDGASDREVALAVAGVGPSTVTGLRKGHNAGMDAKDAAAVTTNRGRSRRSGSMPQSLNITLSREQMERLAMIAAVEDTSKTEFAYEAVVAALADWVPTVRGAA